MAASKQRALRFAAFLVACFLVHEATCATTSSSSHVETIKNKAVHLVLDGTSALTTAATWTSQAIGAFLLAAGIQAAVRVGTGSAEFGTALTAFINGAVHMWWVWAIIALALLCAGAYGWETLKQNTAYSNQVYNTMIDIQANELEKTNEWSTAAANAEENPHMFSNGVDVARFLRERNKELDELKGERTRLMKMMAWDIENSMHRDLWTQMTCWSICSRNVLSCVVDPVPHSTCHVSKASMDLAKEHLSGPVDRLNTKYKGLEYALNRVSSDLKGSATTGERKLITQLQDNMVNGSASLNTTLPTPGNADVATGMVVYYTLPVVALLMVLALCAFAYYAQERARKRHAVGWRKHPRMQRLRHYTLTAYAWCKWCCPIVVFVALSGLQYWNNVFDAPHCMLIAVITAFVYSNTRDHKPLRDSNTRDRGSAPMRLRDVSYLWNTDTAHRTPTAGTVTASVPVVFKPDAALSRGQRNMLMLYGTEQDSMLWKYRDTAQHARCTGASGAFTYDVENDPTANVYMEKLHACVVGDPPLKTLKWVWDTSKNAWMLHLQ